MKDLKNDEDYKTQLEGVDSTIKFCQRWDNLIKAMSSRDKWHALKPERKGSFKSRSV